MGTAGEVKTLAQRNIKVDQPKNEKKKKHYKKRNKLAFIIL